VRADGHDGPKQEHPSKQRYQHFSRRLWLQVEEMLTIMQ